jgi:hypothetical protein
LNDLPAAEMAEAGSRIRPLKSSAGKLRGFTHTLEKRFDGRCTFLTAENQCFLHHKFGADSKPSMCLLFPYTFTDTPEGVFAGVSFASSGALFNSGKPLSEQRALLAAKWELFQSLFPQLQLDWSSMQLIDGVKLDWPQYRAVEGQLLAALALDSEQSLLLCEPLKMSAASDLLMAMLPKYADMDKNFTDVSPRVVDQLLVKTLLQFYFPADVFSEEKTDLPARAMAAAFVKAPPKVTLDAGRGPIGFQSLLDLKLGSLGLESENLLRRFIYLRIFAKLYFGAGFHNLSLICGFHHLCLMAALLRIKVKTVLLDRETKTMDFVEFAELVRVLERRLTDAQFSRETLSILEVLLRSPARLKRILALAA